MLAQVRQLHIGDVVTAHFFTKEGEISALRVSTKIIYHSQKDAHAWQGELANAINVHVPLVKVGCCSAQGWVIGFGSQPVMAHTHSGITHFKLEFQCKFQPKKPVDKRSQYDHVFPQAQHSYRQGTRVWHEPSGRCYRCKPWPFTEYCRNTAPQFEPGSGALW
ncbi:hypothetical protein PCIT_a3778 [Pseudoalteromonas citrea]|uniref:N-acetylglucosamine binding protein A domain-containing protein n=2 Tax=Pseudoalteromonas citrea TaxID=43655 RepID=A0AAD4FQS9_9GAMM|nr:hypothetical protein PCIT_a3778 [Pseudoalteromonas citrea]